MNYFKKIPTINYQGKLAKNLLARAKFSDETRSNKLIFHKYTTGELDRVDNLSNDYYESPGYSWLVWFSNEVIDPYYDMALSELDFIKYVNKKYGSVERSARKIMEFRLDWNTIEPELNPVQFRSAGVKKKYYEPVLDQDLIVTKYVVRKTDLNVSTNKIIQLSLTGIEGNFIVDEELRVDETTYGTVVSTTGSSIILKHVIEDTSRFVAGASVLGVDSKAVATIDSITVLSQSIPLEETLFWQPLTYFDYELELNSAKKEIKLLDTRYVSKVENDFRKLMGSK